MTKEESKMRKVSIILFVAIFVLSLSPATALALNLGQIFKTVGYKAAGQAIGESLEIAPDYRISNHARIPVLKVTKHGEIEVTPGYTVFFATIYFDGTRIASYMGCKKANKATYYYRTSLPKFDKFLLLSPDEKIAYLKEDFRKWAKFTFPEPDIKQPVADADTSTDLISKLDPLDPETTTQ